jgi:hypothetical protein
MDLQLDSKLTVPTVMAAFGDAVMADARLTCAIGPFVRRA